MKKLILGLFVSLLSGVVMANVTSDQEYILNGMNSQAQKVQLGTLINKTLNLLVARYSYAVQGGSTSSAISLLTNLNNKRSYAVLPSGAVIKNVWVNVLTAPTSGSTLATVALQAASAGDLLGSTLVTALPTFQQGVPTGATSTFVKLNAQKTIKVQVGPAAAGSAPLTAGKFDVFIEYVLGN